MIESVSIRHFQSIESADLALSPFVVIVGASSSGKSAFIRALRLLAFNQRGTAFISHGAKSSSVTAHLSDATVTITRSTSPTATNSYQLTSPELNRTYTKLNATVPDDIASILKLSPINFASQFDSPFLLADSPAQAASLLASLTNAHIIFDAARHANTAKLHASQLHKTRTNDLQSIRANIPRYKLLKSRIEKLDSAERLLALAQDISLVTEQLQATATAIHQAEQDSTLTVSTKPLPDIESIQLLSQSLSSMEALAQNIRGNTAALDTLNTTVSALTDELATVTASINQARLSSARAYLTAFQPHTDDHNRIDAKRAAIIAADLSRELH